MLVRGDVAFNDRSHDSAPWLAHYPGCVPHHLEYPAEPVYWLLEQAAERSPDRVAVQYYAQEFTYEELLDKSRRMASVLIHRGLQPGDRVGVLLPNVPEYLIALFGTWMAGGVAVPLNPLMVAEETAGLLEATGCRTVVCLDVLLPLVCSSTQAQPDLVLLTSLKDRLPRLERLGYAFVRLQRIGFRSPCRNGNVVSLDEALEKADPNVGLRRPAPDDFAYILATGGTTGNPKAVVLRHRNMLANAWQLFHWSGGRIGEDTILAVLPFFHSYGLSVCGLTGIAMGATLVMHHRFRVASALRLIEQRRPTILPSVPAMLVALNKALREKKYDTSSLRFSMSGGAALDPKVGAEFTEHTGAVVVEGYGLSEASPVTHVGPLDGTNRPGTIGLPISDTEARIVDADTGTRDLPPGEVGELIIRGPQVMAGYWNNPEATARTIRDGWLYTGDLASRDADGFFRIVDRKKDLIITSGFNVYPTDVEQVLRKYPGLADVAVVGVPDLERGEIVKAILKFEKGKRFDRKHFDDFARQHLAAHKRPRAVEVIDGELPRNFLGKVLRKDLRNQPSASANGNGNGNGKPVAAEPARPAEPVGPAEPIATEV